MGNLPRKTEGAKENVKNLAKYTFLTLVLAFGFSAAAHATPTPCASWNPNCKPTPAPEVDPSMAVAGISLLAGTLAVVRARVRK
jgi:hypothetical protein